MDQDKPHPALIGWADSATWGLVSDATLTTDICMPINHKGPAKPLPILADLLRADPTLRQRLEAEGHWHRVDVAWAQGSVRTAVDSLAMTCGTWRGEMHAEAERHRVKAGGGVDAKGQGIGRRMAGRRCA